MLISFENSWSSGIKEPTFAQIKGNMHTGFPWNYFSSKCVLSYNRSTPNTSINCESKATVLPVLVISGLV